MAFSPLSRYPLTLFFFIFFFESPTVSSNSSFTLNDFGQNSNFSLHGDARFVNGVLPLQITAPSPSSFGGVVYTKPIKIYGGIPKKFVSFSTNFTFSKFSASGHVDFLSFIVFPDAFDVDLFDNNASFGVSSEKKFEFLSVTLMNDVNLGQFGIGASRFVIVSVRNLSFVNLGPNSGEKLQTWIDYEAGSRRIEVRLSRFGENRPLDPLLVEQIDLSKVWPGNEEIFVGLSSSNGNSSQICNVYSWSFTTRQAPDWMHSQPLDPMVTKEVREDDFNIGRKSDCLIKILGALILGIGFGALGTSIVVFLWTVFGRRLPIVPEEFAMKSIEANKQKKLKLVLDKANANEKQ